MVASYEMIFTQPDSIVTYSKTGMLFGAELASKAPTFVPQSEIANLSGLCGTVMGIFT